MLLNKYFFAVILILAVVISSCDSDRDSEKVQVAVNYDDPAVVLSEAQKVIGENVKFAYKGYFLPDSSVQIAAGDEVENNDVWGIRFYLLKQNSSTRALEKIYETDVLEGSFRESMVKKIKFPDFNNELIYYSSEDYFLGSGGGEVFAYIINFELRQTYYAHLFTGIQTGVSLYLSENTGDNIKNFFASNFRRDFPGLKLASRDVDLQ